MDRQRPYPERPIASTLQSVAAALADAQPAAGVTRVAAIDGRSGAGKSTFAAALAQQAQAALVSLEDLYGGWDSLVQGIALASSAVLEPLARGEAASVPRYDWEAGEWGTPWLLEPPALLVIEGVGAGARTLAAHTSLLVCLELDEDSRRRRALARDGELYAPHWERWARQEQELFARERPWERCDYRLVDGRLLSGPSEPRAPGAV